MKTKWLYITSIFIISTLGSTHAVASKLLTKTTEEPVIFDKLVKKTHKTTVPSYATTLEENGVIRIDHSDPICFDSTASGEQELLIHEGSLELPGYAQTGIVFANGWRLSYQETDHHVATLSSGLIGIQITDGTLSWFARGLIRDHSFNDPYRWCYTLTSVVWNTDEIKVTPDYQVPTLGYALSHAHGATEVGVAVAHLFDAAEVFEGPTTVSVNTGFMFDWGGKTFQDAFPALGDEEQEDHHLLQVAIDRGAGATYVENRPYNTAFQPAMLSEDGRHDHRFVSWTDNVIFKDNAAKRKFFFIEEFLSLSGPGLGIIEPPFSTVPVEDASSCLSTKNRVQTVDRVIENIPFDYAVPVLSSWNLEFQCSDQHVKDIGMWLHDIEYDKPSGSTLGTLRFKVSSILSDKNDSPGHIASHGVRILGFNRSIVTTVPAPSGSGGQIELRGN